MQVTSELGIFMEEGPWEEDHIWQVESNTDDHLNALAKTLALKFTN